MRVIGETGFSCYRFLIPIGNGGWSPAILGTLRWAQSAQVDLAFGPHGPSPLAEVQISQHARGVPSGTVRQSLDTWKAPPVKPVGRSRALRPVSNTAILQIPSRLSVASADVGQQQPARNWNSRHREGAGSSEERRFRRSIACWCQETTLAISAPQCLHLFAAGFRSSERHSGQVLVGAGSPKTVLPRRAMTSLYGMTIRK
jgi:hypothetical protein